MERYSNVIIIGPGFEQRNSKFAYSFAKKEVKVTVIAQDRQVAKDFEDYIKNVEYIELPFQSGRKNSLPFGKKREEFITKTLKKLLNPLGNSLILVRDITYGAIVGAIIKKNRMKCRIILDIADNFDLFYDACQNIVIRLIMKYGYLAVQRRALRFADDIIVVSHNNIDRIRDTYKKLVERKKIYLIRNLPIVFPDCSNKEKKEKTMVYVGRIDEYSRDLLTPLKALITLSEWELHLYSDEKKEVINKMKNFAKEQNISERLIIHERVPYDRLINEISKYTIGLIVHKRNLLTDYTIPNKLYDYRNAGIVSLMSNNPSMEQENDLFEFGVVYSTDIESAIIRASQYSISKEKKIPTWKLEFDCFYNNICK